MKQDIIDQIDIIAENLQDINGTISDTERENLSPMLMNVTKGIKKVIQALLQDERKSKGIKNTKGFFFAITCKRNKKTEETSFIYDIHDSGEEYHDGNPPPMFFSSRGGEEFEIQIECVQNLFRMAGIDIDCEKTFDILRKKTLQEVKKTLQNWYDDEYSLYRSMEVKI
jgi:hypothetical protein